MKPVSVKLVRRALPFVLWFCTIGLIAGDPQPGLKFIPNRNQWPSFVHASAKIPGGTLNVGPARMSYYFEDGARMLELHERGHHPQPDAATDWNLSVHAVHARFVNARTSVEPMYFSEFEEYYNYFLGNNPLGWTSGVHAYGGVLYPQLYDNIDLKIYSQGVNLKYDFVVAPYGDPSNILIQYNGASSVALSETGDLLIKTSFAEIIEKKPVAYQYIEGKRLMVRCEYLLSGNQLSFYFPDGYDECYELVIDPLLIFSTYSGSTADNWGSSATPGENGNLYSTGTTNRFAGGNYPVTEGVFQTQFGGIYDIGILKYDSTGGQLLYSTFLGGSRTESPHSLVMDWNGDLIVLGTTSSSDFPTTKSAFDTLFNGGPSESNVIPYDAGSDIFVARISGDGTQLLACTLLGGEENDGLNPSDSPLTKNYGDQLRGDVITDQEGNIYISSVTGSSDFPAVNSFQTTYGGGETDAILVKLSPDLSHVIWGAFLGGVNADASHTLQVDSEGNIFIAGGTNSSNFPVTAGSYLVTYLGDVDGWIAKVAADGSALLKATFTGTRSFDQIYFLDLNQLDEPYVFGQTNSSAFPKTSSVYDDKFNSGQFIQKFNGDLSTLLISTAFGSGRGEPDISPTAFLVNDCNNLFLSGWAGAQLNENVSGWNTSTHGLYVTDDAFQKTTAGNDFYFMVLTADVTQVLYATFLGGTQSFTHVDGGTSRFDKNGIVYHAVCSGCNTDGLGPKSDFPTTPGAWSRTNNSVSNCNNAAFKFDLSSLKAIMQTNSEQFDSPGLKVVCIPDAIVFENFSIGGEVYHWDLGDGTTIVKSDKDPIVHFYQAKGRYTVKLKAIDQGTCQVVDSIQTLVTVNQAASVVQEDDDLCPGDSYQLRAAGGVSYEWKTLNGVFSGLANPTVSPIDTTSYFVTVIESNGCVRTDTVVIRVVPAIDPTFTYSMNGSCTDRPFITVSNTTEGRANEDIMVFDFGDGQTSDLNDLEHHYEKDGLYAVTLVGSRSACVFDESVNVPIYHLTIPNIITPGGTGGLNDRFTIQFGEQESMTPTDYGLKTSLIIYNRWGTILYTNEDYQYDWLGEGLAAGIYYYEVKIAGYVECKSWLQIVK